MRNNSTGIVAVIALIAALSTTTGRAAAQSTSGIFIGAQATGSDLHLGSAAEKVNFGGGWGVRAGVGLGERLTLLANYDRNNLTSSGGGGDYTVGRWDALARINFLAGSPVRPYVHAGATGVAVKTNSFNGQPGDYHFDGIVPTAGFGLQLFVSPAVALDGGASWTFGNFKTVKDNGTDLGTKLDATGTRVMIGAVLYPFGHR